MVFMQPNFLVELAKMPEEKIRELGVDFSEMAFVTGGSGFNATNSQEVADKIKANVVFQAYGSTETSGVCCYDELGDAVHGSAGKIGPNSFLKVILRMRF